MLIGHYGFGMLLKRWFKDVPLWVMFIFVQLVDIFWVFFIALGIERVLYNPVDNPFLRFIFEFYPYSHSLIAGVILAAIVYSVFIIANKKSWALPLGIAVVSHWFLDLIMHEPDLPLLLSGAKVGFGLWMYPILTVIIELGLLFGGAIYLASRTESRYRKKWLYIISILFSAFYLAINFVAPATEPNRIGVLIFGIITYGLFTLGGYWVERKK